MCLSLRLHLRVRAHLFSSVLFVFNAYTHSVFFFFSFSFCCSSLISCNFFRLLLLLLGTFFTDPCLLLSLLFHSLVFVQCIQSAVLFIRFLYPSMLFIDSIPFLFGSRIHCVSAWVCLRWYWFKIKCTRDNEWYSHNVDYVLWWRYSMLPLSLRIPSFFRYTRGAVFYDCVHFSLPNWAIECVRVCVFLYSSHLLWIPQ